MTTFALIHGAWHGAWCWDPLIPELERRGHRAVAVDLPCDDPAATTMDNAKRVADALAQAGAGEDLVVVGHSLGGLTAPVIPLLRPVRRVVFLCALIPRPGRSYGDVVSSEPETTKAAFNALPRHVGEDGSVTFDPAVVGPYFYQACPPETVAWAAPLLRTQVWTTTRETCPLDQWPDCELSSIICTDDEVVTPSWSRRLAHEVLHVAPTELPGGHFPMIAIPSQLADTLSS